MIHFGLFSLVLWYHGVDVIVFHKLKFKDSAQLNLHHMQDVHYIGQGEKATPFSLRKIAGGVQKKGQIQMCTRNRIIWDGE